MVGTGMIAVGIVFVLLLGEIDLSVGSVSGVAGAIFAVLSVTHGMNEWLAVLVAIASGAAIGAIHGFFFARIGVPAFAVTLAGLLFWNGFMLQILGEQRHHQPRQRRRGRQADHVLLLGRRRRLRSRRWSRWSLFFVTSFWTAAAARPPGMPSRPLSEIVLRTALLAVVAFAAAIMFNQYKGLPLALVIFLVVLVAHRLRAAPHHLRPARSSRSAAASRRPAAPASTSPRSGSRSSRSPAPSRPSAACSGLARSPRRTRAPAPATC